MLWLGVLVLVIGHLLAWYAACIHVTSEHRMRIITTSIGSSGLMTDIARVPFTRHFWFVFFFRDYRRLYASATWRANGWTR